MSVTITCDREDESSGEVCKEESIFMGEDFLGGRYVYSLPRGWTRTEDGHRCPRCSKPTKRVAT